MFDIELRLQHQPGELARMGEALGQAGVSVEGGGMFVVSDVGVAHFLVKDADTARAALEAAGMQVAACRAVLSLRLKQDEPGQLGRLCGAMAHAGVNIEVLYSDHNHQLILCVDDADAGRGVRDAWQGKRCGPPAMLDAGLSEWLLGMLVEYGQAYSTGWSDYTTNDVQELLERQPRRFADFARDHAAAFTSKR